MPGQHGEITLFCEVKYLNVLSQDHSLLVIIIVMIGGLYGYLFLFATVTGDRLLKCLGCRATYPHAGPRGTQTRRPIIKTEEDKKRAEAAAGVAQKVRAQYQRSGVKLLNNATILVNANCNSEEDAAWTEINLGPD